MNQRSLPKPGALSPLLGMSGLIPSQRSNPRRCLQSNALSAITAAGFCFGLPRFPGIAGMLTTSGRSVFKSCRFAASNCTTSGTPAASVSKQCFEPDRPRSVGFGPVLILPRGLSLGCNRPEPSTNRVDRLPAISPGTVRACAATNQVPTSHEFAASTSCTSSQRLLWANPSSQSPSSTRITRRLIPLDGIWDAALLLAKAYTPETTIRSRSKVRLATTV